jgi:hypothetical protein
VICADPAATADTRPAVETVATPVLFELQLTTRPVNALLLASRVTAESCTVSPVSRLGLAGLTDTDATGTGAAALTVIMEVPDFVSLEAVIVAFPAATAVTRPDAETVLMFVLLELHVTARPLSTLLLASRVLADSCSEPPTSTLADAGVTDTVATGTGAAALTVNAVEAD